MVACKPSEDSFKEEGRSAVSNKRLGNKRTSRCPLEVNGDLKRTVSVQW